MNRWVPQSIVALRHYNRHTFVSDAIAGVTVGLVALPLAMAFAIASGMSPQAGIYCAIVAGFLTAALGGSMTAIGGPTGAFVVVVAGIIGQYGINGLFLCTMMAGIILIALGASGVGSAVKYIPTSSRHRFYQRHCRAHREHAAARFLRAAHRGDAR